MGRSHGRFIRGSGQDSPELECPQDSQTQDGAVGCQSKENLEVFGLSGTGEGLWGRLAVNRVAVALVWPILTPRSERNLGPMARS